MSKKLCLKEAEDVAFYESGLVADGCLEKLDTYAKEAIMRYGRHLLRMQKENTIKDTNFSVNE